MAGSRTPDPIGLEVWMASKHDPAFKPTKTRRLPVKGLKPYQTSLIPGRWILPGGVQVHVTADHDGERGVSIIKNG